MVTFWYVSSSLFVSGSCLFFFKQKTAYEMRISDWSSDVCSSDLGNIVRRARGVKQRNIRGRPRMIDGERLAISVQQRRRCPRPAFQFDQALAEAGLRLRVGTAAPEKPA